MRKLLLVLLLVMIGCGGGSSAPTANQSNWEIRYSHAMPSHPTLAPDGVWNFVFPGAPLGGLATGSINYITEDYTGVPRSITMVFRVDTEPGSVFNYDFTGDGLNSPSHGCVTPPSVTLLLEKQGDDMQAEDSRWWAGNAAVDTSNGTNITVTVPIDPAYWTNVQGKPGTTRPSGFQSAVQNLGHIGMTFGGGCSYGHGLNVTGHAKFTLVSYTIS